MSVRSILSSALRLLHKEHHGCYDLHESAAPIPEPVIEVRNAYPGAVASKHWPAIRKLAKDGQKAKAMDWAKRIVKGSPRAKSIQSGSVAMRRARAEMLRAQVAHEREMKAALSWMNDRFTTVLLSYANDEGIISPGRAASVLEKLRDLNREAYKRINSSFTSLVRKALKLGAVGAMDTATASVEAVRKIVESEEAPYNIRARAARVCDTRASCGNNIVDVVEILEQNDLDLSESVENIE